MGSYDDPHGLKPCAFSFWLGLGLAFAGWLLVLAWYGVPVGWWLLLGGAVFGLASSPVAWVPVAAFIKDGRR